jgi:hypothetical protein
VGNLFLARHGTTATASLLKGLSVIPSNAATIVVIRFAHRLAL